MTSTASEARAGVLEILPALVAMIAPALVTGSAEAIAGLVTVLAAFRLPLIVTVAIGVATVSALRALIG